MRICWGILLGMALWGAAARGASIFDDEVSPPKDPTPQKPATPAPPPPSAPTAPAPTPRPSPRPQAKPAADPRPQPAPTPRRDDSPRAGNSPAEDPRDAKNRATTPLQQACAAAREKIQQAQSAAEEVLRKDKNYAAAEARAEADAAKGDANSADAAVVRHLRDNYLARDAEYLDAERYLMMLTRLAASTMGKKAEHLVPESEAEFKEQIANAIQRHDLVEGMTFQEACKSARKPFELVHQSASQKTYHWILKGRTGARPIIHRDARGRNHTENVETYGVVGYVEGIFEGDYLVSFSRGK